jgi:hypothetical protein
MATVYLHIGTPKTGTTAIQNFLMNNNEILNKHGICFPDFGLRYSQIGLPRNAHFMLAPYIDENGERSHCQPAREYEPTLDKIAELAHSYDTIILSDEAIWRGSSNREDFWPRLKNDFAKRNLDLKIIVYLRRQDLWVQSFWAQKIKRGLTFTFQGYLDHIKQIQYPVDYYEYMELLSSIFGKDALIIRLYEKEQYQGTQHTLISDFLNIFHLELDDSFHMEREFYNPSLQGNYIEIRRMMNYLPDIDSNSHILKQSVRDLQAMPEIDQGGHYTWHDAAEHQAFLDQFEASNSRLAREYLGREDGRLFYHPVEEPSAPYSDEASLYRDMLLVYAKAIQMLEKENRDLEDQIKETRKELKAVRENVVLYRLKRKIRHISGKEQPK